ncbi:murein DD-endopeptidase MepM/ murein hydrolase activator NlpD [Mycoplana sp. BE70]|uniref:peptidoglycan DD-metalloendopeptidase family protein n=1 Tax=Mycoplana sp. BE70 TaxID=2817775 RepID=UPI002859972F|nr:peptidoglycan DD-metalloendopeptidase family protein [Mycoplana sp. BE70]MDR6758584.1 murein DD-endopeptidase MepM/ murein hydrolase activator NlpD [Mycoplana sp. BE70]
MRKSVSPSFGKTAPRLLVAVLLAGAATGCSSDATRFGGLFSSSDDITTNSIPRRTLFGSSSPVPRGDVNSAGQAVAMNQPYPVQDAGNGAGGSSARMATTPMDVQRTALADPTAGSSSSQREVAMAQPIPTAPKAQAAVDTGTSKGGKSSNGWSTANAPVVMMRPGESVKTLSNRYGVPEKEILKANGMKSASDAEPGQKITIPVFGTTPSAAKASIDTALNTDNRQPLPDKKTGEDVAILPGSAKGRDKAAGDADKTKLAAGDGGKTGGYEIQPGDSLAKIAARNGVTVDELKKANGLTAASIRVGQKLSIPSPSATDKTMTASLPDAKKAVEPVEKKAEAYAPVAKTQTVAEIETKADLSEAAPESTGIGKYRWPVRGAVIAGYGANVEGSRNEGIDISVPEGTPIKAAENGVVIYSGSSLKELGNAVLVRHDDGTVTVYGHASSLNVQRGQKVQRGQTLAASGMSGSAARPKLHFEVRKNASPVNPMTFLE